MPEPLERDPQASPRRAITVFVAMPFVSTITRNQSQLTYFFDEILKSKIENDRTLMSVYTVRRSDETLNINDQIIRDIYTSDVMICDLSGEVANPNVMYELGLRFGLVDKPIILIRELHPSNKHIFDVSGLFTFGYDPFNYSTLTAHISKTLKSIEDKTNLSRSPIFSVLGGEAPLINKMSKSRASLLIYEIQRELITFLANFTRIIAQFLQHEVGFTLPRSPVDYHVFLYDAFLTTEIDAFAKNETLIASAPWDKIHYSPMGCPPLDYCISSCYLYDVFDGLLAHLLYQPLQMFRLQFFNSWYLANLSAGSVFLFMLATATMIMLVDRMLLLLVAKSSEEQGIMEELKQLTEQYVKITRARPEDLKEEFGGPEAAS